MMNINADWFQQLTNFQIKKSAVPANKSTSTHTGTGFNSNSQNQNLAEELHQPNIRKLKTIEQSK